jgi:hypothetical protein
LGSDAAFLIGTEMNWNSRRLSASADATVRLEAS